MHRDTLDFVGGVALGLTGLCVAIYSFNVYPFGQLRQVGPGFFPVILGSLLCLLGTAVAIAGYRRQVAPVEIHMVELVCILGSVVAFALLVEREGILLSTAVCVMIASIPARRNGMLWRVILAAVGAVLTWAIFVAGLRLPLPVFPWSN